MYRAAMFRASIILLFVLFLLPVQGNAQPGAGLQGIKSIKVVSSPWPPYTSEEGGFFMELVSEAFSLSGVEVEYVFAPWARCCSLVRNGEAFGAIPFAKTAKREQFCHYSKPIFKTRNPVIFNRKTNADYDYQGLESLRGYRLVGMLGWFFLDDWNKAGIPYRTIKDQYTAFRMIVEGRIDLTVFDEFSARHQLRMHPQEQDAIGFSQTSYTNKKLYLTGSKEIPGSRELLDQFNANLEVLGKNGFIDKLAAKYELPRELFLPTE